MVYTRSKSLKTLTHLFLNLIAALNVVSLLYGKTEHKGARTSPCRYAPPWKIAILDNNPRDLNPPPITYSLSCLELPFRSLYSNTTTMELFPSSSTALQMMCMIDEKCNLIHKIQTEQRRQGRHRRREIIRTTIDITHPYLLSRGLRHREANTQKETWMDFRRAILPLACSGVHYSSHAVRGDRSTLRCTDPPEGADQGRYRLHALLGKRAKTLCTDGICMVIFRTGSHSVRVLFS